MAGHSLGRSSDLVWLMRRWAEMDSFNLHKASETQGPSRMSADFAESQQSSGYDFLVFMVWVMPGCAWQAIPGVRRGCLPVKFQASSKVSDAPAIRRINSEVKTEQTSRFWCSGNANKLTPKPRSKGCKATCRYGTLHDID